MEFFSTFNANRRLAWANRNLSNRWLHLYSNYVGVGQVIALLLIDFPR